MGASGHNAEKTFTRQPGTLSSTDPGDTVVGVPGSPQLSATLPHTESHSTSIRQGQCSHLIDEETEARIPKENS